VATGKLVVIVYVASGSQFGKEKWYKWPTQNHMGLAIWGSSNGTKEQWLLELSTSNKGHL
jgi:hypothetical protein